MPAAMRPGELFACYTRLMKRTVIAFIVAPLWAPFAYGVARFFLGTPYYPDPIIWELVAAFLITLGGELLLGFPAFLFLRSHRMTAFWVAPVSGCIVGATWGIVFAGCFLVSTGVMYYGIEKSVEVFQKLFNGGGNLSQISLGPALLGTIVGTTLWLIARPDRREISNTLESVGAG